MLTDVADQPSFSWEHRQITTEKKKKLQRGEYLSVKGAKEVWKIVVLRLTSAWTTRNKPGEVVGQTAKDRPQIVELIACRLAGRAYACFRALKLVLIGTIVASKAWHWIGVTRNGYIYLSSGICQRNVYLITLNGKCLWIWFATSSIIILYWLFFSLMISPKCMYSQLWPPSTRIDTAIQVTVPATLGIWLRDTPYLHHC